MKKIIILLTLIIFSCGSRKVTTDKLQITKDSAVATISEVKLDVNKKIVDNTNILVVLENEEFVITPIDASKAIIVNGKIFKNAVISAKKNKSSSLYTNTNKVAETKRMDSSSASVASNKTQVISNSRISDKKESIMSSLLIYFLIILFLIILRIAYKKIM